MNTHLPGHLDSLRQKVRPKHQLLVQKCYPRLPKNSAAEAKPNGSELSYLLYYASTRRSKLQKVGSFLERKTASDVTRAQSARVVVTLHILTALLENKAIGQGSGFALIAPYVLRIVREVLQNTNDISLIEASLPTWDVFCRDQDLATLKADHEYRELYEDVVKKYATFASKDEGEKKMGKNTRVVAVQDAIRLRKAGLGAIESILQSDRLQEVGRQLEVVVPAILSNMRGDGEKYLTHLLRVIKQSKDDEKDKANARRMSMVTVRTYTNLPDSISVEADPRQAEGTAQDADAYADEEAAILASECLKAVFDTDDRGQIRAASTYVLRYILEDSPAIEVDESNLITNTRATNLYEICTACTPVQDRFVLVINAVDMLARFPLDEEELPVHLLFTDIIGRILRSDLNLIGLSVMDVLLSLIQHILRVLQLNGPRVAGRSSAAQVFSSDEQAKSPPSRASTKPLPEVPSQARLRLIVRLKHCISDLATHVYYTDQVTDMLSAIFMRLRPNAAPAGQQNPTVTAAAIEDPQAAVKEVASNVSVPARERSNSASSGYFSFDTARQVALEAARDMLQVANSAKSLAAGGYADSRNKVPITVWEGTQWLLRDPAFIVRKAYVEALTTWLQLETKPADARLKEPEQKKSKAKDGTAARRALSNASKKKDKQAKKDRSTFLQLLHLAVYEHAMQYAKDATEGDQEFRMLHLLLFTLVRKLGVNAVMHGLPMIFALQEDMERAEGIVAKIRLGSLVHSYFLTLAECFDWAVDEFVDIIFDEVKDRRAKGLFMHTMWVPPKPMEVISVTPKEENITNAKETSGTPVPFTNRQGLVDRIAESYAMIVTSPPPSAPGSPARTPGRASTSAGVLERTTTSYLSARDPPRSTQLPEKVKNIMMETWSRESCLAAIAAAAPKSVSLSGSRSSPSHALALGNHRQLLAAANAGSPNNITKGTPPSAGKREHVFGPSQLHSHSQSPNGRHNASSNGLPAQENGNASETPPAPRMRIEELKRVLYGTASPKAGNMSSGSESMVEVSSEVFGSETSPSRRKAKVDVDAVLAGIGEYEEGGKIMEEPPY